MVLLDKKQKARDSVSWVAGFGNLEMNLGYRVRSPSLAEWEEQRQQV